MKDLLRFLILPLFWVMILALVLEICSYQDIAMLVSLFGTAGVLAICLAYIVFFDSRRRWPDCSTFERFARVVTFYRD